MNKSRVLVFGNSAFDLRAITKGLMLYANVKEISWQCKPIPLLSKHIYLKAFYRMVELFHRCLIIFREICMFHADVILVQYAFHYGLIGGVAAKLSRRPCVVQVIGSDLKVDPRSRLGRIIICLAFKITSGVICVSKDLENIAKKLGAKDTIVIPSPLDISDFPKKSSHKKNNQIITVMKLTWIKGAPYLLKAMSHITEANLLIIGEGPERKNLESLSFNLGLGDRVFFLGWISHSMVWKYLQESTIFVLPSLSEGTPRVILEAMACGLPIVATKVGGIPEIMTDGVNGFLVPPMNERSIAEAVKKILNDIDFQRKASKENIKLAKKFEFPIIDCQIYKYLEGFVKT